ncbi:recombinase family protein [Olivibacter domesticus]|uniref:Resolvase, N terminal domain n=1 Tax=Olivibacter domesticus TaxID=407022 RepID=A0A1H7I723_OLID1|nr:recombinase family protein [Olivibacter domesticus]SEK58341.1 Resolvase, N terminal domain [Olivibacter domesticus]
MEKCGVVGYIRSAVFDGNGEVIRGQEEKIRHYAERYNLDLVKLFVDNGVPGNRTNRWGWDAMMEYLSNESNKAKFLVVCDLCRISRDFYEFNHKVEQLRLKSIRVLSVDGQGEKANVINSELLPDKKQKRLKA